MTTGAYPSPIVRYKPPHLVNTAGEVGEWGYGLLLIVTDYEESRGGRPFGLYCTTRD